MTLEKEIINPYTIMIQKARQDERKKIISTIETFRKSFIKTLDLDDLCFPLSTERLREVIGIGYDDDGTVTVDWKDIDNIVKWTVKKANEKIAKKLEELESLKKEVKP